MVAEQDLATIGCGLVLAFHLVIWGRAHDDVIYACECKHEFYVNVGAFS